MEPHQLLLSTLDWEQYDPSMSWDELLVAYPNFSLFSSSSGRHWDAFRPTLQTAELAICETLQAFEVLVNTLIYSKAHLLFSEDKDTLTALREGPVRYRFHPFTNAAILAAIPNAKNIVLKHFVQSTGIHHEVEYKDRAWLEYTATKTLETGQAELNFARLFVDGTHVPIIEPKLATTSEELSATTTPRSTILGEYGDHSV